MDKEDSVAEQQWRELCSHIRTTDEISFKLLGLVPLVSVAGIAAALMNNELQFTPLLVLLSLFAAGITMAIWIWERRNIETCLWLIERAAELEEKAFNATSAGHFYLYPETTIPCSGKRYAEQTIYRVTFGAWLLLPLVVLASRVPGCRETDLWGSVAIYALSAPWIAYRAWPALKDDITPPKPRVPKEA